MIIITPELAVLVGANHTLKISGRAYQCGSTPNINPKFPVTHLQQPHVQGQCVHQTISGHRNQARR